jgi:hypothetical protein
VRRAPSGEVVRVHVVPGLDRLRGKADHLPVAAHRSARVDPVQGDLVPAGDKLVHSHLGWKRRLAVRDQDGSFWQVYLGDRHVVLRVEVDRYLVERNGR